MENQVSTNSKEQLGVKSYQAVFITKVYNWMALALLVTGVVAYLTATTPQLMNAIVGSKIIFCLNLLHHIKTAKESYVLNLKLYLKWQDKTD
jgi:FtsH-binding integral membrane protein